jgi:CARDB
MDRAKWIGSLVVACLLTGAGSAMAQDPTPPPAPTLGAALETCQTSALPVGRVASFVGSMPATTGASRMQMRFDLQRRRPDEKLWSRVPGVQGFDVWETAMPGRAGFVFHKRVDGLQAPAAYRAVVRFRWSGADGTILRREVRRTPSCNQPDLRPDLVPASLHAVLDAHPALAVYSLVVRNAGRSPAGPFTVRVAGAVKEVAGLAAGQQLEVAVLAPSCIPGSTVRAVVDADQRIDEADEHNALKRRCPLPA